MSDKQRILFTGGVSHYGSFQALDLLRGITSGPKAQGGTARRQVCNLSTEAGNHTKDEDVGLVIKQLPKIEVTHKLRPLAVKFAASPSYLVKLLRDGFCDGDNMGDGTRSCPYPADRYHPQSA